MFEGFKTPSETTLLRGYRLNNPLPQILVPFGKLAKKVSESAQHITPAPSNTDLTRNALEQILQNTTAALTFMQLLDQIQARSDLKQNKPGTISRILSKLEAEQKISTEQRGRLKFFAWKKEESIT